MAKHDAAALQASVSTGTVLVASAPAGRFTQRMMDGRHLLHADEPVAAGGDDKGPGPYELLLMALGSCTSMTVQLYAARKKWPLEQVIVRLRQERIHVEDCANCEKPGTMIHRIEKRIEMIGPLDEAQRARLFEVSERCPVHRTLVSKIEIHSALDDERGPEASGAIVR